MGTQMETEKEPTTDGHKSGYRRRSIRSPHNRNDELNGLDDWLMTYADMITLLLCFFALLLSVSVPKREVFEQAREKVLEKFASAQDQVILLSQQQHNGQSDEDHPFDSQPSIVDRFKTDSKIAWKDGKIQTTQRRENNGNRIDIIDIPSTAFFASGSAVLSNDGKEILVEILGQHLTAQDTSDYQITIEGHTDDIPINTPQFPSNWELSTARAASVVRFLIDQGIQPQRLRAAGYADTFPKVPNRDDSGRILPDNQAQNRRVLIKLEKIDTPE